MEKTPTETKGRKGKTLSETKRRRDITSVADPHRKNADTDADADADPGKNLNVDADADPDADADADADSCPY
jgi:hypothetical protein